MRRAYKVVDVFTREPLRGNPVAVVLAAEGLNTEAMQRIACWTNLSETSFVLPATHGDVDYRLRIFSPRSELPFAGHPTLGSAHALLEAGLAAPREGALVQECGAGLIDLKCECDRFTSQITLPMPAAVVTSLAQSDVAELEEIIGAQVDRAVAPALVDVGVVWVVAQLSSAQALLALIPDDTNMAQFERRLGVTGVSLYGAHPSGGLADIEVRSFLPSSGVVEDPVCGSGNGSIAAFRFARGLLSSEGSAYVASQGQCVGRDGRVFVHVTREGKIHIGGECRTSIDGALVIE